MRDSRNPGLFRRLFPQTRPIIGMIHLPPLPDYRTSPGIDAIVGAAIADLEALSESGFDGVLIENEYDRPHRVRATAATIDAMTTVTRAVAERSGSVRVGCEILLHDPQASLRVALDGGAEFIRTDYFVDRMSRPEYGEFEIDPEALLEYRRDIGADGIAILADIQVKYATMLEPRLISESAELASRHGADAIVVTGDATGDAPTTVVAAEAATGASVPVLIGSGFDRENAFPLLEAADGAIVGSSLMRDRRVDRLAANALMDRVRELRHR